MKPNRRFSLLAGVITVLVIGVFVAFAPARLGGQSNYIVVNGGSMLPDLRKGDLAIVRNTDSYQPGDVATYRHPQIGHVIHRVIGKDETGRYILQGDNNDYIDPYHPAQSEMVGKLWIHVPRVGAWMSHLREPRNASIAVFFTLCGLGGGGAKVAQARFTRRRRRYRPTTRPPAPTGRTPMNAIQKNRQDIATVLGVAAAGFALLALVACNRPLERTVSEDLGYTQSGEFSYTATAPEGTVYDTGAATPGEPVFRALSDGFSATFTYAFESQHPHHVQGTYRFLAEVSDDTGWRRTMELVPATTFVGSTVTAQAAVSIAQAQQLIDILNTQTGVVAKEYSLSLRPEINLDGTIGGEPLLAAFAPSLAFELDEFELRLPKVSNQEDDPLHPTADGVAARQGGEANTLALLNVKLPVATARLYSVLGLGLTLLLGGILLISTMVGVSPSAPGTTAGRGLTGVVTIRGSLPPSRDRLVDVATLDDLSRLAESIGGPLLQEISPGYHCFYVCDMDITYRYQPAARPRAAHEGHAA